MDCNNNQGHVAKVERKQKALYHATAYDLQGCAMIELCSVPSLERFGSVANIHASLIHNEKLQRVHEAATANQIIDV
jgi:hypothetical protein